MTPLFVDTSAFVALASKKDRNHRGCRRLLERLVKERRPLMTSTDIVDEVVTLLRMRLGHRIAVEVGDALLDSKWCKLLDVDGALRASAWNLFKRFEDQTFSLTDCTSFALMRSLGMQEAFTLDRRDFAAAGFVTLPNP